LAGTGVVTAAWILGAVSLLVCCFVLPGIGYFLANKAQQQGNPNANAAKIFNLVMLVIILLGNLGYAALMIFAASNGVR
jgi:uncharacterized membrane protein YidH (DUF202 family)